MKPLSTEQKLNITNNLIAAGLLMGFAFWVNRGIEIKGLAADDLSLWVSFSEQSFFSYVFPLGGPRFRCLYYLASWLELALVGPHIHWLVPINIVLNGILAVMLCFIGERLSGRKFLGFLSGLCFLMSRMAFYQIGLMHGLMETMAFGLAVWLFYCLYRYLHEKQEKIWYFHGACILYFALCFVHERFMVLVVLFYLVLAVKRRFQPRKWFWPVRQLLFVLVIRFLTMGKVPFAGVRAFFRGKGPSVREITANMKTQLAYLLGINAGPQYLNGLSWQDTPGRIRFLVYGADIVLLVLLAAFLVKLVKMNEQRLELLGEMVFFLAFPALCMLAASTSSPMGMQQVYISYGAMLLMMNFLCGVLAPKKEAADPAKASVAGDSAEANYLSQHSPQFAHKKDYRRLICAGCIGGSLVYLLLMAPAEQFFRGYYDRIYLWPDKQKYNSLAEQTYGIYGEDIFGKTIYILGNEQEISEEAAEYFFRVFDRERKAEGTRLAFIDSVGDIGLVTEQMLVLRQDEKENCFQDVTQFVKELKFKPEYGIYEDGWIDEECAFTLLSGKTGKVTFRFLYPGALNGDEVTEIYLEEELVQKIDVRENIYYGELQAGPYQMLRIAVKNNFYMENALEQRGEKRLTALLEVVTE